MKYLGVDYGTRKCGIALSDELGMLAFPKEVVPTKGLLEHVERLIAAEEVAAVIIGNSKERDGSDNALMEDIRDFIGQLAFVAPVPVYLEEERYTSVQARQHSRPSLVDAAAAALILQTYLDKRQQTR